MPIDWTIPYKAAMREKDAVLLAGLSQQARRAIQSRCLDRAERAAGEIERRELAEARHLLSTHEWERESAPSVDWRTPFRAALNEQDPAKLPEMCESARWSIHTRLMERERRVPTRKSAKNSTKRCARL